MKKALRPGEVTLQEFRADVAGVYARAAKEGSITVVDAKGRAAFRVSVGPGTRKTRE